MKKQLFSTFYFFAFAFSILSFGIFSNSFATKGDATQGELHFQYKTSQNSSYQDLHTVSIDETLRFNSVIAVLENETDVRFSADSFRCNDLGENCVTEPFRGEKRISSRLDFFYNNQKTSSLAGYSTVNSGDKLVRLKVFKNSEMKNYEIWQYDVNSRIFREINKKDFFSEEGASIGITQSSNRQIFIEAKVEAVCELNNYKRSDDGSSYVYVGEVVEQNNKKYTCLDTGKFDIEDLAVDVDLVVVSKDNLSLATLGEKIDLDFGVGVLGCGNDRLNELIDEMVSVGGSDDNSCNSESLEGKKVDVVVEWDSGEFDLVDDSLGNYLVDTYNDRKTGWQCLKTSGGSGNFDTKITCSATSHTALDKDKGDR